jgi:hypothetical protein
MYLSFVAGKGLGIRVSGTDVKQPELLATSLNLPDINITGHTHPRLITQYYNTVVIFTWPLRKAKLKTIKYPRIYILN